MSEEAINYASVPLEWDGDVPDADIVALVRNNLAVELGECLSAPRDLIFHHIYLTEREEEGPFVLVDGRDGSDAFHCEIVEP